MTTKSGRSWLFAVSGGPDSMVTLHMFLDRAKAVCHVNYHARPTADADEELVRLFCAQHGLPLLVLDARHAKRDGNFQNWARRVRYEFFVRSAVKLGCAAIVTGHTSDDFLETAAMQAERGGKRLFYGIAETSSFDGFPVIRPNLACSKRQIVDYASSHGVPYGLDESNGRPAYARNKKRIELAKLSEQQREAMLLAFHNANRASEGTRAAVAGALQAWQGSGFSARFFKDQVSVELHEYVLYAFLSDRSIRVESAGKLGLLADFICHGRGGTSVRLGQGLKLKKQSGVMVLVEQKE